MSNEQWQWPEHIARAVDGWAYASDVLELLQGWHAMGIDEFDLLVGLARYCEDHWCGQGDPLYAIHCAIDLRNDKRRHDDPAAVVYVEIGMTLTRSNSVVVDCRMVCDNTVLRSNNPSDPQGSK